jgi:hypothetical protein
VRIEHDLPLPMILMGEPLANYVKSLDCRCELASEARRKTENELLFNCCLVLGAQLEETFKIAKTHFCPFFVKTSTRKS